MFADDVFTATGIKQSDTLSHLVDTDASREDAIVMWKYACSSKIRLHPKILRFHGLDFGIKNENNLLQYISNSTSTKNRMWEEIPNWEKPRQSGRD